MESPHAKNVQGRKRLGIALFKSDPLNPSIPLCTAGGGHVPPHLHATEADAARHYRPGANERHCVCAVRFVAREVTTCMRLRARELPFGCARSERSARKARPLLRLKHLATLAFVADHLHLQTSNFSSHAGRVPPMSRPSRLKRSLGLPSSFLITSRGLGPSASLRTRHVAFPMCKVPLTLSPTSFCDLSSPVVLVIHDKKLNSCHAHFSYSYPFEPRRSASRGPRRSPSTAGCSRPSANWSKRCGSVCCSLSRLLLQHATDCVQASAERAE